MASARHLLKKEDLALRRKGEKQETTFFCSQKKKKGAQFLFRKSGPRHRLKGFVPQEQKESDEDCERKKGGTIGKLKRERLLTRAFGEKRVSLKEGKFLWENGNAGGEKKGCQKPIHEHLKGGMYQHNDILDCKEREEERFR